VGTTDDGYFGSGIYFTNKLSYASAYAKAKENLGMVFVISLVTLGNPFPVTEQPFGTLGEKAGFYGKPCKKGYQSHFSLVYSKDKMAAFPVQGDIQEDETAIEYVAFDALQCLPLFLVFYEESIPYYQSFPPPSPPPLF